MIIIDGEATTQVFESIGKKTFIFDKRFNNGITSKLGGYQNFSDVPTKIIFGSFYHKLTPRKIELFVTFTSKLGIARTLYSWLCN